jgi:hypothetical protein
VNGDDLFWEDLLLYLEQGQVIPIIGQDLLSVEIQGRSINAYRLMAERLAEDLKISTGLLPQDLVGTEHTPSVRNTILRACPVDGWR